MRHMDRQTNAHGDSYIPSKTLFAGILKKTQSGPTQNQSTSMVK